MQPGDILREAAWGVKGKTGRPAFVRKHPRRHRPALTGAAQDALGILAAVLV